MATGEILTVTTVDQNQANQILPVNAVHASFIYLLMEALAKSQNVSEMQQMIDATSTEVATSFVSDMYQWWYNNPQSPLVKAQERLQYDAKHNKKNDIAAAQAAFNQASSESQAQVQQGDGEVQTTQGVTAQAAVHLQEQAQEIPGFFSILSTLSGFLGNP